MVTQCLKNTKVSLGVTLELLELDYLDFVNNFEIIKINIEDVFHYHQMRLFFESDPYEQHNVLLRKIGMASSFIAIDDFVQRLLEKNFH